MIGQVLGHFRVVEQLGAGGMGVVYRAHDEQLGRDVALKVLPSGVLAGEAARKQFRKEALALAMLNHPNIATIYEFASQDGVDYLVMEMIEGTPLNARLKSGPLSQTEVMRLGIQLMDGLAAAHEKNVIHRDLKPGNLIITRDHRLKILDFGLAFLTRPAMETDVTRSISLQSNVAVGTLPYMSPEQLGGQHVDARSDIFSAGAVLYEAATGQRPFPQAQGPILIGAILHKDPPPPSSINSGVHPGMETVILRALSKDPAERYQTAREVGVALETLTTTASHSWQPVVPVGERPKFAYWKQISIASAILTVISCVLVAFYAKSLRTLLVGSSSPSSTNPAVVPAAVAAGRPSIAVLGLVNASKQPKEDWLASTLPEMLTTDLGAGGNLRTTSGEDIARMRSDLALPVSASYSRDTLARIQSYLGTDRVVTGSYLAPGNGEIRLDLRLQDTRTGETQDTVSMSSSGERVSDLVDLVSRSASALREKMSIEGRPPSSEAALKASIPSTTAAAQSYVAGLERLRNFDALGAVTPLKKAIDLDSNFALGHSALAQAWSTLGYDERALSEQLLAVSLSGPLSAEERGLIQGRADELQSQWDKAATFYLSLKTLYPGEIEYGLLEANAQIRGGKPRDALETLHELRNTAGPAGQDPRIDLRSAEAAEWLGDAKLQEISASAAEGKAAQLGARWLAASAQWHICTSLVNQGNSGEAEKKCVEARDSAKSVQDPLLEARSLTGLGNAYAMAGKPNEGLECHRQALQITRTIGAQRDMAGAMLNIADLLYTSGDLKSAHQYYQESLQVSRGINNRQGIGDAENGLAADLYAAGEYSAALPIYEDILKSSRASDDQRNTALALNAIGIILFEQGKLKDARSRVEESLAISQSHHIQDDSASWLVTLGDIQTAQNQMDAAAKSYRDALATSKELGQKAAVAQSSTALAGYLLETGAASQAQDLARQAAEEFHSERNADLEADALNTLTRAFLVGNNVAEARKSFDQASTLPAQDQGIKISLRITSARLMAAEGQSEQALKDLSTWIPALVAQGFKRHEFEARLAKLEIQSGLDTRPGVGLEAGKLQADASASGFDRIADRARALARSPSAGGAKPSMAGDIS